MGRGGGNGYDVLHFSNNFVDELCPFSRPGVEVHVSTGAGKAMLRKATHDIDKR